MTDLERLPDGRLLFTRFTGQLSRLLPDLSFDPSFGTGGTITIPSAFQHRLKVGVDGLILVIDAGLLRRFTSSGVLLDFVPPPVRGDLAVQSDGRVLAVGSVQVGSQYGVSLVRYVATLLNLVSNGSFSGQLGSWIPYGEPTSAVIQHNFAVNGVFEFYRLPPGDGTPDQATVFQQTARSVASGAPIAAQFDLGNSSSVRKRISVLILEHDFSDLSVCTFWLPANSPLTTYRMRTHTTKTWSNAAIYFYAATVGEFGGRYLLDNVSMNIDPTVANTRTECVDPYAPAATAEAPGVNLVANGDFSAAFGLPWFRDGNLVSQVSGGVFEFYRIAPTFPAGVVANLTGEAMNAGQIVTASFQLGNASSIRQRVTVILGAQDFSDLSACTFWLPAGQPLSAYVMRTYTTMPQANHLVSVYSATVANNPWMRLDNVTLQRTPGTATGGTDCIEPGDAGSLLAASVPMLSPIGSSPARPTSRNGQSSRASVADWLTMTTGRETLLGWRSGATAIGGTLPVPCRAAVDERLEVLVSVDDGPFAAVTLPSCLEAESIELDVSDVAGRVLSVLVRVRRHESEAWQHWPEH